jgi:hypothetical protein
MLVRKLYHKNLKIYNVTQEKIKLLKYRAFSINFNLYTSKLPRNIGYFERYKLSLTFGNLY